jgi:hypothetical protein
VKKVFLFFAVMTQVLIIDLATSRAGVGGSGGGPRMVKNVSVEVCGDIPGQVCSTVNYIIRIESPNAWSCNILQENASETPCPAVQGIPAWLVKLNEAYQ